MSSTYTTRNGIEKIGSGEQAGAWGVTTNTNFDLIDESLDGQVRVTLTATGSTGTPNDVSISDGASSDGRNKWVDVYSASDLGGTCYVRLTPNDAEKITIVRNSLGGSQSLVVFQGTYNASNVVTLENGEDTILAFDGAGTGAVVKNILAGIISRSIRLADNTQAYFGTDNDAQIYHSGGNFFVQNGTGELKIIDNGTGLRVQSDAIDFTNAANTETLASFDANGAVSLYYNNVARIETTSTGMVVTGTITPSSHINLADDVTIKLGTSADAAISHDGSNTTFTHTGTGDLHLRSGAVRIKNSTGTKTMAVFADSGTATATLYYEDSARIVTSSAGVSITGSATMSAGVSATSYSGTGVSSSITADTGSTTKIPSVDAVETYVTANATVLTNATRQTASGTSVDFTGIPAGVKEIVVMFDGLSTNSNVNVLVQIGGSGGIESTGYISGSSDLGADSTSTAGFVVRSTTGGDILSGTMHLNLMDAASFQWVENHGFYRNAGSSISGGGSKSLSSEITQIRITTSTGSPTFDAGTINIAYR